MFYIKPAVNDEVELTLQPKLKFTEEAELAMRLITYFTEMLFLIFIVCHVAYC